MQSGWVPAIHNKKNLYKRQITKFYKSTMEGNSEMIDGKSSANEDDEVTWAK